MSSRRPSRLVSRLVPPLASLLLSGVAGAASPAAPPDVSSMLGQECGAPQVRVLAGGSSFIRCTSTQNNEKDGAVTRTRYFLVQPKKESDKESDKEGKPAIYLLIDYTESRSLRVKVGTRHQVTQSGTTAVHRAEGSYGHVGIVTWDLAAHPPRIVRRTEGGNRECRQGIEVAGASYETPALTMPRCEIDYLRAKKSCSAEVLGCKGGRLSTTKVRWLAIPSRPVPNTLSGVPCALQVGADKQELLAGQNRRATSFQVAAQDDAAAKRLRLVLQVKDATPQVAPPQATEYLRFDHYELWLSDKRDEPSCIQSGGTEALCKTREQAKSVRLVLLLTNDGKIAVLPAAPTPAAERLTEVSPVLRDGALEIELTGELRVWAQSGAIAVRYGDSETGTRRDTLLGTTSGTSERPETWGQLAEPGLCEPPPAKRL